MSVAAFAMPDPTDPRVLGVLIEAKLQNWNITYEYVPAFDLDQLEVVEVAQVRFAEHRINPAQVEEYRQQMDSGATFPPLVVMHPNIVVDGNTRRAAAMKVRRIKTLPAFVARFPSTALARAFAAAINQTGGRRLAPDEARASAQALLEAGYTEEAVSLEVGYSRTQVGKWKIEMAFAERARRTGIAHAIDDVKKAQQHQIGQLRSDPVFAEVARTVLDLNPPAKDVTDLVKIAKEAHSDADALHRIAEARTSMAPAGPPPYRATVSPALAAWRRCAPQILGHEHNPLDFLEVDPARRQAAVEMWRQMRGLSDQVLAGYGA